jgi:hypothetical protein
VKPDERAADAIDLVQSKRQENGRWVLDVRCPGTMLVDFGEMGGQPSRWITLRALRVLRWWDSAQTSSLFRDS